jgi:hypothetical protein
MLATAQEGVIREIAFSPSALPMIRKAMVDGQPSQAPVPAEYIQGDRFLIFILF